MGNKIVVFGVVIGFLCSTVSPALAADPLFSPAAIKAAAANVATAPATVESSSGTGMMWGGMAMLGAGVTLEILSYTSLKRETAGCLVGYYDYVCAYETSTNKPVMAAGLGLAGAGAVLWGVGAHKRNLPSITIGRRTTITQAIRF